MRAGLTMAVVVLNVAAIVSIIGSRRGFGRKLAWTAAVVLLPIAGAAGWFVAGRRR